MLDGGGNPAGGGTATSASLPSGARFVFVASTGFKAIPLGKAF
jgi:hypothetical protein